MPSRGQGDDNCLDATNDNSLGHFKKLPYAQEKQRCPHWQTFNCENNVLLFN